MNTINELENLFLKSGGVLNISELNDIDGVEQLINEWLRNQTLVVLEDGFLKFNRTIH
jgi:hypothetical protein